MRKSNTESGCLFSATLKHPAQVCKVKLLRYPLIAHNLATTLIHALTAASAAQLLRSSEHFYSNLNAEPFQHPKAAGSSGSRGRAAGGPEAEQPLRASTPASWKRGLDSIGVCSASPHCPAQPSRSRTTGMEMRLRDGTARAPHTRLGSPCPVPAGPHLRRARLLPPPALPGPLPACTADPALGGHSACARGPSHVSGAAPAIGAGVAPAPGTALPDMGEGEADWPPAAEKKGAEEEEDDFGYRLFPDRSKKPQSFLVRSLFTFHNKCQLMLRLTLETSKRSPVPSRARPRRCWGRARAVRGRCWRWPCAAGPGDGPALPPSCRSIPAAAGLGLSRAGWDCSCRNALILVQTKCFFESGWERLFLIGRFSSGSSFFPGKLRWFVGFCTFVPFSLFDVECEC